MHLRRFLSFKAGKAYLFERDDAAGWILKDNLQGSESAVNDLFGASVYLDNHHFIVGAPQFSTAYLFGETGEEIAILRPIEQQEYFGNAVLVEGNDAFVGSGGTQLTGGRGSGGAVHSFRFDENAGEWIENQRYGTEELDVNDGHGVTLAFHAGQLVVGAPYQSKNIGIGGAVYYYPSSASGTSIESTRELIAGPVLSVSSYPNPSRASFTIRVNDHELLGEPVEATIYDMQGRLIERISEKTITSGFQSIRWIPQGHASGVYFCRIKIGESVHIEPLILQR